MHQFLKKNRHVWVGLGILFLVCVFPLTLAFLSFRWLSGLRDLMPMARNVLEICFFLSVIAVFCWVTYVFYNTSKTRKGKMFVVLGAISGAALLVAPSLLLFFLLHLVPEEIVPVRVEGRNGDYVISKVAGFGGHGFTLYQAYFGIFRHRVASSWRWRSFNPPQVKLFYPDDPYRKTIYIYDMNAGTVLIAPEE